MLCLRTVSFKWFHWLFKTCEKWKSNLWTKMFSCRIGFWFILAETHTLCSTFTKQISSCLWCMRNQTIKYAWPCNTFDVFVLDCLQQMLKISQCIYSESQCILYTKLLQRKATAGRSWVVVSKKRSSHCTEVLRRMFTQHVSISLLSCI